MISNIIAISNLKSPDLVLITSEGWKVHAHATILGALSPWLGAILKDQAGLDETICISVPFNIVDCKEFVEKIESCESNSLKSLGDASTFFETFPEIANCEVNLLKKETDVSFKDHYETVELTFPYMK